VWPDLNEKKLRYRVIAIVLSHRLLWLVPRRQIPAKKDRMRINPIWWVPFRLEDVPLEPPLVHPHLKLKLESLVVV
jgi:hypothetical protein